jgi:hypothetical protein
MPKSAPATPPDAPPLAAAEAEALAARLSPPASSPVPAPLPAVQLGDSKTAAIPGAPLADDVFARPGIIDKLLTHPMAEVRQRAAEAQVALHHGSADIGIKVRAAIDTARGAETRR